MHHPRPFYFRRGMETSLLSFSFRKTPPLLMLSKFSVGYTELNYVSTTLKQRTIVCDVWTVSVSVSVSQHVTNPISANKLEKQILQSWARLSGTNPTPTSYCFCRELSLVSEGEWQLRAEENTVSQHWVRGGEEYMLKISHRSESVPIISSRIVELSSN